MKKRKWYIVVWGSRDWYVYYDQSVIVLADDEKDAVAKCKVIDPSLASPSSEVVAIFCCGGKKPVSLPV